MNVRGVLRVQYIVCNCMLTGKENVVCDICYIQVLLNRSCDVLCYTGCM